MTTHSDSKPYPRGLCLAYLTARVMVRDMPDLTHYQLVFVTLAMVQPGPIRLHIGRGRY